MNISILARSLRIPLSLGILTYFYQTKAKTIITPKNKLICQSELDGNKKIPEYFEEVIPQHLEHKFPNLKVLQYKPVDTLIGQLRDLNVNCEQFRFLSKRVIRFIIEEALASECDVVLTKQSPLGYYQTFGNSRTSSDYAIVSILRSGNAMVDEFLTVVPDIAVGNILVQRNEASKEKEAIYFFDKLPVDINRRKVFLVDPMIGTGNSAMKCIEVLKNKGVKEENIIFLNFISCEGGIATLFKNHPNMKIITAKVDPYLLPNKYLAPGLGDFGDRYFSTQH